MSYLLSIEQIMFMEANKRNQFYINRNQRKLPNPDFYTSPRAFFPSYNKIHNQITKEYSLKHDFKINKLSKKIDKMKKTFNFQAEHKILLQSILKAQKKTTLCIESEHCQNGFGDKNEEYNTQEFHEFMLEEILKQKRKRREGSDFGNKNVSSLNEMLQDEEESAQNDHNKFEAHLKFRKKALMRELFENENEKRLNRSPEKEDQKIFRNLFSEKPLQNESNRQQKKQRLMKNYLKQRTDKNRVQSQKKSGLFKQNQTMQQNKEKLKYYYKQFLQDLKETNIVKCRILNK